MFNDYMVELGNRRSCIRDLYEFGRRRAADVGEDSVFDFSLGNPSVPSPAEMTDRLKTLIGGCDPVTLHGYTTAAGDMKARKAIAEDLKNVRGARVSADYIYMTCGAAAAVAIALNAILNEGDEVILLTPYFPEYEVFVKKAGGKPVFVGCDEKFCIDFQSLERALGPATRAIIVNSPNNPSGIIYDRVTLKRLCDTLDEYQKRTGNCVYIVSDEPYREIVYDGAEVADITSMYDNSLIAYSFSKSLSMPGERIGYIALNPSAHSADRLYAAIMGAGRALGYVCAPSLFQRLTAACLDLRPNIEVYRRNRDALYGMLTGIGFECVFPQGAFYMLMKALDPDACAFSDRAKDFGLLLVPGDDFGAKGYVRLAYCVDENMIKRSEQAFKKLYNSYK